MPCPHRPSPPPPSFPLPRWRRGEALGSLPFRCPRRNAADGPRLALSPSPSIHSAVLRFWCPEPSRNVSKPPEKSEHTGLLPLGPTRPRQCALPRPAPTITSCRRARGWGGGSRGGRGGASLRCPRVAGPVCAALAAGSAAGSRGGGGLRAPSAPAPPAAAAPPPGLATPRGLQWRGRDAKPGPCPPPLGGATSGMFALS